MRIYTSIKHYFTAQVIANTTDKALIQQQRSKLAVFKSIRLILTDNIIISCFGMQHIRAQFSDIGMIGNICPVKHLNLGGRIQKCGSFVVANSHAKTAIRIRFYSVITYFPQSVKLIMTVHYIIILIKSKDSFSAGLYLDHFFSFEFSLVIF